MNRTQAFYRARQLWGSQVRLEPYRDAQGRATGAWIVDNDADLMLHMIFRDGSICCHERCAQLSALIVARPVDPDLDSDHDLAHDAKQRDKDRAGL